MGGGKKGRSASKSGASGDQRALRNAVDAIVNEAVTIQDSAASLPPAQASGALELAAKRYREALERFPGHAEAAYNLATCISEQAALQDTYERQVALRLESRALLEGVVERDTSGRGATTALAHHAAGNVIRDLVEAYRGRAADNARPDGPLRCFSPAECMEQLQQACRHLDSSISIEQRLQNPSGHVDEALVHFGDTLASMMDVVMGTHTTRGDAQALPPVALMREASTLCSSACAKYSEALAVETSSGGSDVDTLRLKAGAVIEFLDWALPEAPSPEPVGEFVQLGFQAEALLTIGEEAAGTLLGLEQDNVGGFLAKGDLCRLRARVTMLSGARLEEEGRWREESVQWFARAVAVAPQNADALSTAGEGSLEYGKRSLRLYEIFGGAGQAGEVLAVSSSPLHGEGTRTSGIARLQDAGNLLSRAASAETSDPDVAYNAACAFALSGDHNSCSQAFREFCRRLVQIDGASAGRREAARNSLQQAWSDGDLEGVKDTDWFLDLARRTEVAILGEGGV
ncbi:unnamed protein product [Ascophyllum nodosum]